MIMSETEQSDLMKRFGEIEKLIRFGFWVIGMVLALVISGAIWMAKQEFTDAEQWRMLNTHDRVIDQRSIWMTGITERLTRMEERQAGMIEVLQDIKVKVNK